MTKTICFFNSCRTWGGGEKWHLDTAMRLSQQGFPVVVGVYPDSQLARRLRDGRIRVFEIRISNLSFLNPLKIWKIREQLQAYDVASIILNLPSDVKAAGIAAKLAGVPKVIYRRGSAIPVRNSWFNRFLFRNVIDLVVTNSEATQRSLVQQNSGLIAAEKIHVIYNGIDLAAFDRTECAAVYTPPSGEVVLGTAGRLEPQKNQRFLIDVALILKKRGILFKMLIAGKGSLEADLRRIVRRKDLSDEVLFLGFVENIRAFMQSLDIFLLSSHWEGFGYVLIEAMACGKPVVSLCNSSEAEIVVDGETGFLIPQSDPVLFADRIEHLIQRTDLQARFGRQGRARVVERFTAQRAFEALKEIL
ncbi:MAG TPA: glycosyltransferase [Desulfobacterales bacterium]